MLKLTQKEAKLVNDSVEGINLLLAERLGLTEKDVDALLDKLEQAADAEEVQETWLTRLEDEARELHDRLWKLYDFQSTEVFKKLDTYDQLLLSMQYNNMHAYLTTLNLRLNKAKTNV